MAPAACPYTVEPSYLWIDFKCGKKYLWRRYYWKCPEILQQSWFSVVYHALAYPHLWYHYYDRIFVDARTEDTIDFYKLLFEIKNPGLLEKFVDQKLGRLLDHDKKHNSDLADTLYLYLKHWGSIQDIAAESYCHRNTVTNRIHILTEQLGYDLVDSQQRFELMTAFMIREFNKLQKKT